MQHQPEAGTGEQAAAKMPFIAIFSCTKRF
jgi:hypothetical protein